MGRAHAVAAVIEDAAGQQGLGLHPACLGAGRLFIQFGLNGIEQGSINDWGLFALKDLPQRVPVIAKATFDRLG